MATGATMRAAIAAVRQRQPARVIIAVPVAASATCEELAAEVDEVVCILRPESLYAVGLWYEHFSQITDQEVADLLEQATHEGELTTPQKQPRTSGAESLKQGTRVTLPARDRSRHIRQSSHLSQDAEQHRQRFPPT